MPKKNKFRKGERIGGISGLVGHLGAGGWTYINNRPIHPRVVIGLPLRALMRRIGQGRMHKAIPTEEAGS